MESNCKFSADSGAISSNFVKLASRADAPSTSKMRITALNHLNAFLMSPSDKGGTAGSLWNPYRNPDDQFAWCAFLCWLRQTKAIKAKTARSYLGAIGVHLQRLGAKAELSDMPLLYATYKGWRKLESNSRSAKTVLTYSLYQKILSEHGESSPVFAIMLKSAFTNLLRVGEITGERAPRVLHLGESTLTLPASKTDAFHVGVDVRLSPTLYEEIKRHVQGRRRNEYIFSLDNGVTPVGRATFCRWLSKAGSKGGSSYPAHGHSIEEVELSI